jgi:hypothetical protein
MLAPATVSYQQGGGRKKAKLAARQGIAPSS